MNGRVPELDGVRGLAILLVLFAHAVPDAHSAAGPIGVTLFFVLSGYLITGILERERREHGRIRLRGFYLRRAARLGPALFVVLAFVAIVGIAGGWTLPWAPGVAVALGYVSNWSQLLGVNPGPMGHAWSLSIEEQFYALWPMVLILLPARPIAIIGAFAGTGLYAAGMPGAYFSSITNGGALLAGCAIALYGVRLPRIAGALGLALVVGAVLLAFEPIGVLAGVLIIASGTPALVPIAIIGRRAYSLYLWNFPLFLLLGPLVSLPFAFLAAEISYRFVETPAIRWAQARTRGSAQDVSADAVLLRGDRVREAPAIGEVRP